MPVTVVQQQDVAGGNRLLDHQRDRRHRLGAAGHRGRLRCCYRTAAGARPGRSRAPQPAAAGTGSPDQPDPVHQLRSLRRPRGRGGSEHLTQRAAQRGGEWCRLRPGQGHRHRDHLSRGEVQRGERQGFVDDVTAAPPGLRVDRDARLLQRQDVPLDRPRAYLIPPGQLSGRLRPRRRCPQLFDQRIEPISPVHASARYPQPPTFQATGDRATAPRSVSPAAPPAARYLRTARPGDAPIKRTPGTP